MFKIINVLHGLVRQLLPNRAYSYLKKKFNQHFNNPLFQSYGQFGEDAFMVRYFVSKGITKGNYVDIGAYSPMKLSNTYLLHKMGWAGINVDASEGSIALFHKVRPTDQNINAAISSVDGMVKFPKNKISVFNSIGNSSANDELFELPSLTLHSLLDKYLDPEEHFEFLNVDVEGHDLEVLKSNDWIKYRPRLVLVEDHGFNVETFNSNKILNFMSNVDYRLISWIRPNLIFERLEN